MKAHKEVKRFFISRYIHTYTYIKVYNCIYMSNFIYRTSIYLYTYLSVYVHLSIYLSSIQSIYLPLRLLIYVSSPSQGSWRARSDFLCIEFQLKDPQICTHLVTTTTTITITISTSTTSSSTFNLSIKLILLLVLLLIYIFLQITTTSTITTAIQLLFFNSTFTITTNKHYCKI